MNMANVNKTVTERLRDTAENNVGVSTCTTMLNVIWGSNRCRERSCADCRKKMLLTLADMIEAEQAELRAENERLRRDFYEPCARMGFTEHAHGIEVVFDAMSRAAQGHECRVDFKALDLLCEKLEMSSEHSGIAAQIRKAINGAKPQLPDTQETIDDDLTLPPWEYCERHGIEIESGSDEATTVEAMCRHLLERQRKLMGGE